MDEGAGGVGEGGGGGEAGEVVGGEEAAQRGIEAEPFDQRDAATVTRVEATAAALGGVTGRGASHVAWRGALGAEAADEPLVKDQFDRGGDGGVVGAEDQEAFEHTLTRAGVECRDNEVPGERGPDGKVSGFVVADFPQDQHLGVLAEEMPGGLGEVQAARFIDLGLHDAGDDLFGGVFDGDDVAPASLGEVPQAGIDGGGLAAAGGAGQEQEAGGLAQEVLEFGAGAGRKAQFFQALNSNRVEQTQDDFLAGDGWVSGDPDVAAGIEGRLVDAPILREGLLVGLEPGEELDSAKDAFSDLGRPGGGGGQHAIEAEGDGGAGAMAVQMDVAGVGALRLLDEPFEELGRGKLGAARIGGGGGLIPGPHSLRVASRGPDSSQNELSLRRAQFAPGSGREGTEGETADAHAQQAQSGMADGGGHASDLAVASFGELEAQPAGGDGLAKANGRDARGNGRWRFEGPGAAGQRLSALDDEALFEPPERIGGGKAFDLGPVFALVGIARMEQSLVERGFIAEQQEPFGIGIEPADGIDGLGEAESSERPVGRAIGGKPGEDAVRFIKGDEQEAKVLSTPRLS